MQDRADRLGVAAVELAVEALDRLQRGAGIGLLHGGVELPLKGLYILLLVHRVVPLMVVRSDA